MGFISPSRTTIPFFLAFFSIKKLPFLSSCLTNYNYINPQALPDLIWHYSDIIINNDYAEVGIEFALPLDSIEALTF
jgi:hypothetical protein